MMEPAAGTGPSDGAAGDNTGSNLHGASVTETGRPVVVSGALGLTAAQVERLRDSVADVPLCPRCLANGGICQSCLYNLAPKLRRNPMATATLSGDRDADTTRAHTEPSTAAAKVKARKARKAAKRLAAALEAGAAPVVVVLDGAKRKKPYGRRHGVLGLLDAMKAA